MKKTVILLGAIATMSIALTGCATYALIQEGNQMDRILGDNPTKASITAKMGQPVARLALPDQAECLEYDRIINGDKYPFAIGFDKNGTMLDMAYDTCANANKTGAFSKGVRK